jgi:hypothetical protein
MLMVAVAGAVAASATAPKPKPIAFVGTYAGTAVTQTNGNTVAITANGTGTGTMIGAGKITGTGTGDTSQQPCVPFIGTGKMTGAGGMVIFKVIPGSVGCGDQQGENFTVSGKATILKATGKLLKRKGTLKLTGTYDRSSGAFTAKFRGSLVK